jgi:two-component system CheB/CheR fusion protein
MTNTELEQFAHVSSHDLQEPLRKIRTFAEILKDTAADQLDDASRRYVDKINSTAARMSDTLKALLNFTKMHREEKKMAVDLNTVVAQVLVDLELLISQKHAQIDVGDLPEIKAVPIQMQQLFYNLLNNALKFSKKDVPPVIGVRARKLEEEELLRYPNLQRFKTWYEFTVQDNGIGFEQQYAEKIFTIFQRLHTRKEFEGTGIGLSLVKKVIGNHGGEIRAVSAPGEGTTFRFILPG